MRLEEWSITCVLSPARKMEGKLAKIDFDRHYSSATMFLATDLESEQELFASIFHELLHLHFWWVDRNNSTKWDLLEMAFMKLDRLLAEQYLEIRDSKPVKRKKRKVQNGNRESDLGASVRTAPRKA